LEYCYLIGKKDHPENWRFQNNLENVDYNEIDLIKTFDDYEQCRKWVLKEVQDKRKVLGRLMECWLRRQTYL
jgi:hypothetical protein